MELVVVLVVVCSINGGSRSCSGSSVSRHSQDLSCGNEGLLSVISVEGSAHLVSACSVTNKVVAEIHHVSNSFHSSIDSSSS